MNKILASLLMILVSAAFIGCGNKVGSQLQQSVQVNQDAKSLAEWESSESNPEALFAEWRKDLNNDAGKNAGKDLEPAKKLKQEICQELQALDGQSLSLFEGEIRDDANRELLASCKQALLQQLERYFAAERSTLTVQVNALKPKATSNSFKFPDNIQKRDFSNGYLAVTGDVAKKEVILTFDDGPSPEYTKTILQSLKEVGAKAHFFQLGKNVRVNADITKMVAADGHMVGSHSVTHSCIGNLKECGHANGGRQFTFEEATKEIIGGHQAVYDVLGWVDPIFRFPFGAASPELRKFLNTASTAEFYWNIDSEDWKAQTNENLLRNTLAQLDARGRGIILFHDIQRRTAEILPQLLSELYTRGYSVVQLQSADPAARYNSKLVKKHLP
ncbi:polysaccharide deacetylase family protein [Bdellovibrio svalbardensis]|uniref:Polysaccharide deacetylase family protein n=1 Tax=Bdellovibrio svalbardensis TaxID=2972972 RepID=A0ABT6DF58_9BACT|nr:polysaccharide deacetylase family protein [Bdellovibrio svalbardensis]MDG0815483.1 polysaccharide deacetylase family protein [Bdellovibrio svalbardensis]